MKNFLYVVFLILWSVSPLFSVELSDKWQLPAPLSNSLTALPLGTDYDVVSRGTGSEDLLISSLMTVRESGPEGQVSIPAVDGGLSGHTRASLNGHIIHFAQMDTADLSLFPLELASSADVYSGNLTPSGIDASGGVINFQLPNPNLARFQIGLGVSSLFGAKLRALLPFEFTKDFSFLTGASVSVSSNRFKYVNTSGLSQVSDNLDYEKLSLVSSGKGKNFDFFGFLTLKESGTGTYYAGKARQDDLLFSLVFRSLLPIGNLSVSYDYWKNHYTNGFIHVDDLHQNHHAEFQWRSFYRLEFLSFHWLNSADGNWLISTKSGEHQGFGLTSALTPSLQLLFLHLSLPQSLYFKSDGGIQWIPGLSMAIHPKTWHVKFLANVGRLYRAPTFNDLYWPRNSFSSGNTNLKPEDGWSAQVGSVFSFLPVLIKLNYRHSVYTNLILWAPDNTGLWSPRNIGWITADVLRVSGVLSGFIGSWWYKASAGFSYNKTLNKDPKSVYFGKRVVYIPLYKGAVRLQLSYLKIFKVWSTISHVSERYTTEANTVWLPPYLKWDLGIYWQGFQAVVRNITDSEITESKGYPLPGRHFEVSYTFEW